MNDEFNKTVNQIFNNNINIFTSLINILEKPQKKDQKHLNNEIFKLGFCILLFFPVLLICICLAFHNFILSCILFFVYFIYAVITYVKTKFESKQEILEDQPKNDLFTDFSNKILKPIFATAFKSLDYSYSIDRYYYEAMFRMVNNNHYDNFFAEGNINLITNDNIKLQLFNVKTELCETNDHTTVTSTNFIGSIASVSLPININDKLGIYSSSSVLEASTTIDWVNYEKKYGFTSKHSIDSDMLLKETKTPLDMSSFSEIFEVSSTNEVKSYEILTSDVMSKLLDIYKKYDIMFDLAIKDDTMYIKFDNCNLLSIGNYPKNNPDLYNKFLSDVQKLIIITNITKELFDLFSDVKL